MSWLKKIYGGKTPKKTIKVSTFVLEDDYTSSLYADLLTEIDNNTNMNLIREDSNWDQAGICTVVVIYSIEGDSNE